MAIIRGVEVGKGGNLWEWVLDGSYISIGHSGNNKTQLELKQKRKCAVRQDSVFSDLKAGM